MHFSNSALGIVYLIFYFLMVCVSLIRCEEILSFHQSVPISKETNEELECNLVVNNKTIKYSNSVKLDTNISSGLKNGCGLGTDCADGAGRSWEGEVLLRGLFHLLNACVLRTECYQRRLLVALDRALESDSLRLGDGIYLVKEYDHEQRFQSGESDSESFLAAFTRRLVRLLETHALRVRLGVMRDTASEVRGFHRGYRHAFPMMVGSFMLLAAFTVPMGFQFLAVIGGKALILSQIALFLALGGHVQRYLGLGAAAPAGGFVQHDYYLRDDLRPWHREGKEPEIPYQPQQQQAYISHQQLQGYMNQRRA